MLDVRIADHVDPLVDVLVARMSVPLADPFATEWVAVPSIGMRRWLAQRLAHGLGTSVGDDGVTANVAMPFPDELRRAVLAADLGGPTAAADPWDAERLVWSVLDALLDPSISQVPTLAAVAQPPDGASIVSRAQSVAELFDRYCRHRPAMVRAWIAGSDVDALGGPVPDGHAWQPELFRRVRSRLAVPSPPERLEHAIERVRRGEVALDLPPRLALFGLSTVPPDVAPLVGAVAEHHDVAVLLLTASEVAAAAVSAAVRESGVGTPLARRDDRTADLVRHPLLRSWGDAGREAVVTLSAAGVVVDVPPSSTPVQMSLDLGDVAGGPDGDHADQGPEQLTLDRAPAEGAPHLLARVRSDLRADRAPDRTFRLRPGDRSVQVHACTGPARQVEVLRDSILHLLASDGSLTEGDIVVLCPRIEEFAPVVEAVFGPSADATADRGDVDGDDALRAPLLRYRITDRRLRADVPLLGVLGALLDVLPGRFTASGVADLLAMGPVADRFGLTADDLALLDDWICEANVRWGLDGAHRAAWHLPSGHRSNSWAAGLDQLMMGAAIRGDHLTTAIGGVPPLAVADGSIRTAARVAEAVRTLAAVRARTVGTTATVTEWCELLAGAVDEMCSLPWAESWQRRRLDRVLRDLRDRSQGPDGEPSELPLDLSDVRRLVADLLEGDPARAAFGTGAITLCSLSPLRSVPARVVCVLGLDQDALPRGLAQGDDLLAVAPLVGDRDPRSETRQLLLEAVLAAEDALVITYGAVDVRTNLPVPPAVALDEWLDTLAATCAEPPERVRDIVRVAHPRHGFDPRNFSAEGLGDPAGPAVPGPWGFDPLGRSGALSLRDREPAPGPELLVPSPLETAPTEVVTLDRLRRSLVDPIREFLTQTLGVWFPRVEDDAVDTLPTDLDGLARHQLGADLLLARAAGIDTERWLETARARGSLPPEPLSRSGMETVRRVVDQIERSAMELGVGLAPSARHDIDLLIGDQRLIGTVERCVDGDRPGPVRLEMSKAKAGQRVRAVVDLLALVATDPTQDWRAVVIRQTTRTKSARADELLLGVVGDDPDERRCRAIEVLEELLALRAAMLREPLPIVEKTSCHLARHEMTKAASAWNDVVGANPIPGECSDQHVRAAFGSLDFDGFMSLRIAGRSTRDHAEELWRVLDAAVVEEEP
ncbi:exodeoxyribonuclease V subunit gamma [Dermatobacter hominis]|uniref:exodeoxyribonuclease V subunit gamma n=1 Tax=Dermatobacter hominis TaxID=2884263 RepID=UPI001D0FED72|nr:exodeoxyribonuclease V subunit gamma [Dermatobacter hominis]UDY34763.1 exodeoxyribonuclease V subunit gamma [Dermatobacter hominis]